MTTHLLILISCTPGKADTFKAACGYLSHDKREFIDPTRSRAHYTCTDCQGKICKQKGCDQPRYRTADGYEYQLCEGHLKENFAAIGMEPPRMDLYTTEGERIEEFPY